ncbi:hypothetical protein IEN85_14055 [Pelagicoccus sp. NFK12]|uniref:MrpA C-terminal/MbhE domain-containing protein n=1 Tax=Pelagicoccus enzymogenes TaxID=2773457 RepID=A0A927FBA0_9BACT|nr:hydrogen gas-evolving membrane-bound hydrogenase subunit E [Pelagicoccus enzymogenes]MBD5780621.1 hypothetical protein [Pelagicoccus enzymogenes]MDQ8198978.1 hypothetical protein [Pelagicoccus enzymogenes]
MAGFFISMVSVVRDLPPRGDLDVPLHREQSEVGSPTAGTHYIQNSYKDAGTDNIVTVVLADYRGFDTFGETVVVFAAGIACLLILRGRRES